jgi:hypothetical protein
MKQIIKLTPKEYFIYICKNLIIKKDYFFYFTQCNYKNNRKYHTKMHVIRIHINNGNPMLKKRKF